MGKYMRKGKGVGKMAVIEGALGVRTRARALALQRDSKQVAAHDEILDKQLEPRLPMECCVTSLPVHVEDTSQLPQPNYMDLRSRRFEKISVKTGEEGPSQAGNDFPCKSLSKTSDSAGGMFQMRNSPQPSLQHDSRGVSRQASLKSSALNAGIGIGNRTRVTPTTSTSNSVSMAARGSIGILTRHRRQTLAQLGGTEDMQIEPGIDLSNPVNLDLHAEGEQFFGESLMVAGPSNKDRHGRRTRESTPDSYAWSMEAPGSTSRTRRARRNHGRSLSAPPFNRANEAPSTSEIEAFFEGAEQQERRRFIERYNFDPVSERPLRGRYEWTNT